MSPTSRPERFSKGPTTKVSSPFAMAPETIEAIEESAAVYGSLGRAIMVGTEVLVRRPKPLRVAAPRGETESKRYKLGHRTLEVIDELAAVYGDHARMFAAVAQVLKPAGEKKARKKSKRK